jgi:tetratricopeptide (TPR) repeat protein
MRAPLCIAAICGWLAIAFGQSSATEQQYINQLIANPRDSLAHYNLAEYYFAQKNYMMAVNQYREALTGSLEKSTSNLHS